MRLSPSTQDSSQNTHWQHVRALIRHCDMLPTIPSAIDPIVALVEDLNCSLDTLEAAITQDVACTARLLQMANSAFYGSTRTVTSIRRAILLLGFNPIRTLARSLPLFESFLTQHPTEIATINGVWIHSRAVALLSRRIAYDVPAVDADLALCAGLLHDLGRIALLHLFPTEYHHSLSLVTQEPPTTLVQAERHALHVSHVEVGQWLADAWNLPQAIRQTIMQHHHPHTDHPLVTVVMLADHVVKTLQVGLSDGHSATVDPQRLVSALGLTPHHLQRYAAYVESESDALYRSVYGMT